MATAYLFAAQILGLDASKEAIDAVFDEFDPDGSGVVSYAELKKMLRVSAPVASTAPPEKKASKLKQVCRAASTSSFLALPMWHARAHMHERTRAPLSEMRSAHGRGTLGAPLSFAPAHPGAQLGIRSCPSVCHMLNRTLCHERDEQSASRGLCLALAKPSCQRLRSLPLVSPRST